jgi:ketosteroid isomerase-like protein
MAGDPATVAAIRDLERRWGQAFVKRDFAFLERIVAPEYRLASTGATGDTSITSRADWMRNSRAFHHVAFADEVIDVMTAGNTAVALVRTAWTVQVYADRPAQERRGLCADTWLRRQGQWQVVYRNCGRWPGVVPSPPAGQKATP